ncbi:MAG: hypothetical protein IJO59_02885 [Clostridia bacterium]|nr:hypothetical protein [Clostridia bacterium]
MKMRILAVLLAALLALSLLAGCKPSDKPNDDTTTTTTTAQGDTDPSGEDVTDPSGEDVTDPSGEEETDPSEEETVVTDENGKTQATKKTNRTIAKRTTTKKGTTTTKNGDTTKKNTTTTKGSGDSVVLKPGRTMPLDTTAKWTVFLKEHSYQPIKTDVLKFDALYELTNVELDIDIGDGASASTKLMAAAASGKFYDISVLTLTEFRTYKNSLFYDITDLINEKDLPNYYAEVKEHWNDLQLFSTSGRFYGFASAEYGDYESSVMMPRIRVDIFEENNLKCPTTWKEWFDAMKTLKKKYPDSAPYASRSSTYILNYWTKMLGEAYNINYNAEKVKWECGVLNAGVFKNILQFMKDCYDEGILDQGFDASSEKNFQDLATASKTFFTIDSGSPTAKAEEILQQTNKNAKFVGIMPFKSHFVGNTVNTYMFTEAQDYQSMYYIGSQAERMEDLLFFMDWCYSKEGGFTNNFGKEGVTYKLDKNGEAYVPKDVWKPFADKDGININNYEMWGKYGLNLHCFAPMHDITGETLEDYDYKAHYGELHEWGIDAYEEAGKGYASKLFNLSPDVSEELVQRYDTIRAYITAQVIAFIKGDRDMNEYNNFVADLKAMGIEELLAEANK